MTADEFFDLWRRHLANILYPMTLQTKEPMSPNDFLHGVLTPEDEQRMVPEDVRIARNYTRFVSGFGGGG